MASSPSLLLLVALLASLSAVLATGGGGGDGRDKPTHIRLFIHEKFEGKNATVASPVLSSPFGPNATFGELSVLDDEVRAGSRRSSPLVGRFQGFFVGTSFVQPSYMSAVTLVFTTGEHRGSTLTVQGQFSFDFDGVVERAVVGGTGAFRMASGFSLMKVVRTPTDETVVFKIDLFLLVPRLGRYY